jgi:hypothetical protein
MVKLLPNGTLPKKIGTQSLPSYAFYYASSGYMLLLEGRVSLGNSCHRASATLMSPTDPAVEVVWDCQRFCTFTPAVAQSLADCPDRCSMSLLRLRASSGFAAGCGEEDVDKQDQWPGPELFVDV